MSNTKTIITKSQLVTLTKPGVYNFVLTEPGVELVINGSFSATGDERIKVDVTIYHQVAHTSAKTELRGAVSDAAFISFLGKIKIGPNCPHTNSFLTERILLLSDQAKAEAVPELEILTDDVKCSHAASISSISAEQLFYLMSRGVGQEKATKLIINGFLAYH